MTKSKPFLSIELIRHVLRGFLRCVLWHREIQPTCYRIWGLASRYGERCLDKPGAQSMGDVSFVDLAERTYPKRPREQIFVNWGSHINVGPLLPLNVLVFVSTGGISYTTGPATFTFLLRFFGGGGSASPSDSSSVNGLSKPRSIGSSGSLTATWLARFTTVRARPDLLVVTSVVSVVILVTRGMGTEILGGIRRWGEERRKAPHGPRLLFRDRSLRSIRTRIPAKFRRHGEGT